MKYLKQDQIQKLSFPDCKIEKMEFDIKGKGLKIEIDGGFLSIDGGIKLKSCNLIVENWYSIKAFRYWAKTKKWGSIDLNEFEKFSDICEFEYGAAITLRGFGITTGQWLELILTSALIQVEYE